MTTDHLLQYGIAAATGVALHLGVFIRGEWHLHATTLFVAFIVAPCIPMANSVLRDDVEKAKLLLQLYLTLISALFTSIIIYRVVFHRLRAYPGPFLAKVTKFWHGYHCRNGQNHVVMAALHEKYGNWVRVGPNELAIFDPDVTTKIDGIGSPCTKAAWYDFLLPDVAVVTTRSVAEHDARRRLWSKALTENKMSIYHERIVEFGQLFDSAVARHADEKQPFDVVKWAYWYSFDCIGQVALSRSFNMLKKEEWHHIIVLLREAMSVVGFLSPVPWLARIGLDLFSWIPLVKNFLTLKSWCMEQMRLRSKSDDKEVDLTTSFKAQVLSTGALGGEVENLYGESIAALIAGSDTTAFTLVFAIYRLATHPEHAQVLFEELQAIDHCDRKALQRCQFLDAFLSEVLRLYPAVPTGGLRKTPKEGIAIGGSWIPGDVTIHAPRYVIGRSPDCFARPTEFLPERWTTQKELVKDKRGYYPFGIGRYSCVGMGLALVELRMILAMLVTRYEIQLAPGETGRNVEHDMKDHFTAYPGALRVVFGRRKV